VDQKQIRESAEALAANRSAADLPSLTSMTRPPSNPSEREMIGQQIWSGLLMRFESALTDRDRGLWRNPPERVEESPEHLRLMHAFDDFLLRRFADWGWRLLMSADVVHRISEWEKHAPALLERLGKEMALRSRVLRGEKPARLEEDIDEFADAATEELSRLLRLQKERFGGARRGPTCEEISAWMQLEIKAQPALFPVLLGNLAELCYFVQSLSKHEPTAAQAMRRGDLRPKSFFLLWFARSHNRSLKDVQNELSSRRAERRRSP
jgi:hypothetical protein